MCHLSTCSGRRAAGSSTLSVVSTFRRFFFPRARSLFILFFSSSGVEDDSSLDFSQCHRNWRTQRAEDNNTEDQFNSDLPICIIIIRSTPHTSSLGPCSNSLTFFVNTSMLVAFPAPVLSVTADAVRELEGSEALSGLWTRELLSRLFPFCFPFFRFISSSLPLFFFSSPFSLKSLLHISNTPHSVHEMQRITQRRA